MKIQQIVHRAGNSVAISRLSGVSHFLMVQLMKHAEMIQWLQPKIQQTKILVTCQLVCFYLGCVVWQYSKNQNQHAKGRFKVMAYLQQ